ncbi:MAG TPA: dienelactone hydrolase family protein [Anaerolineales bacterium]|nr:dienelactone hydrolase family protein [Anaerolineales bacterium]
MESMTFLELTDQMMHLYTDGKFADALQLVEQNADRFPEQSARTIFWKMCLLSLCNRPDEVLSIFRQGLDSGLWWAESQFLDQDLNAVRDLPEFKRLMAISQEAYEEARRHIKRDQTVLVPEPPASGKYPLLIALHGRNGNKDSNLEYWEVARQRGWLVLSPLSTQPLFLDSHCWDDPAEGVADLLFYYGQVSQKYKIDPQRVVIAGFSQGGGMAIYAALKGNLAPRGFIGVGTWWADANELDCERKDVRGYFVVGEKDHTLERVREIQASLRKNNIPLGEEVHADLGHAFPADFERSFDKAIDFIFMEKE